MKRFLITLQFMTRIPINKSFDVTRKDYAKGTRYFPLIGLIIGGIITFAMYLCNNIFSIYIVAMVGVLLHIVVTGGMHLDGFSDTCDGLFSGRSREKILEIMKDSRLGTFGGIGLIIIILSRWVLLVDILDKARTSHNLNILSIILVSYIASRAVVMFFMYNRKYAREKEGLGDLFIGQVTLKEFLINHIVLIALIAIINYKYIIIYIITLIIMLIIRRYVEKVLFGITGDILGFSIEFSEIVFIFLSLGVVKYL